jgi:hypothetical protein
MKALAAILAIFACSGLAQAQAELPLASHSTCCSTADSAILRVKNVSSSTVWMRSVNFVEPAPVASIVSLWTGAVTDHATAVGTDGWVLFAQVPTEFGFSSYPRAAFWAAPIPPDHEVLLAVSGLDVYYQPDSTPNTYSDGTLEVSTFALGIAAPESNGVEIPPFGTSYVLGNAAMSVRYDATFNAYPTIDSYAFAAGRAGIHHPGALLGSWYTPIVTDALVGGSLDVYVPTSLAFGPGAAVGWVAVSLTRNDPAAPLFDAIVRINDLTTYFALTPTFDGLELSKPLPTTLSGLIGLPLYVQDFVIPFTTFELTSSAGIVTTIR